MSKVRRYPLGVATSSRRRHRSDMPKATCSSTSLKKSVMNEELEPEIVEPGDAKKETKGFLTTEHLEDSPRILFRQ